MAEFEEGARIGAVDSLTCFLGNMYRLHPQALMRGSGPLHETTRRPGFPLSLARNTARLHLSTPRHDKAVPACTAPYRFRSKTAAAVSHPWMSMAPRSFPASRPCPGPSPPNLPPITRPHLAYPHTLPPAVRTNDRGRYLKIKEVSGNMKTLLVVPAHAVPKFQEAIAMALMSQPRPDTEQSRQAA